MTERGPYSCGRGELSQQHRRLTHDRVDQRLRARELFLLGQGATQLSRLCLRRSPAERVRALPLPRGTDKLPHSHRPKRVRVEVSRRLRDGLETSRRRLKVSRIHGNGSASRISRWRARDAKSSTVTGIERQPRPSAGRGEAAGIPRDIASGAAVIGPHNGRFAARDSLAMSPCAAPHAVLTPS